MSERKDEYEEELEYIEHGVEEWGEEVDKKLRTISPETLTKLEEAEDKGTVVQIDPRELRLCSLNPRQQVYDSPKLQRLRGDISRAKEVYEPLLVRLRHGIPEVVLGGLRWRISILLDLETVPVRVKTMSDEEALAEIESSDTPVPLDPVTRGQWYAEQVKRFGGVREAGRILKVSHATVVNYLPMSTLPDTTKMAIKEGKMSWKIAKDILDELTESYYKNPEKTVVFYTKKYLELKKDKTKRLTRDKFKEWMRTRRQHDAVRHLADYGIPEEKTFGKPYQQPKSKAEREIEKMDKKTSELLTSMPSGRAEKIVKILLESAPEEVQKEYEGKVFGKDFNLAKLEHDITVAEGNQPKLKIIELVGHLFKSEKEADEYFKKFRGRLLEKTELWIGEVDPFLYAKKEKKGNETKS